LRVMVQYLRVGGILLTAMDSPDEHPRLLFLRQALDMQSTVDGQAGRPTLAK